MRDISSGFLGSFIFKRTLRRWERLEEFARSANLANLRDLRARSVALSQRLSTINHIAETRLTRPVIGSDAMDLPPSTDWSHRPDIWKGPISPTGYAPAKNNTRFGDEVTLYHDCKTPNVSLRQVRNHRLNDLAPYGVQLDVFNFEGSFLSLVLQVPESVTEGLKKKHILRVSLDLTSERPLEMTARLNLKHGPNTEQVSRTVEQAPEGSEVEFDLAYIPFNETRAEQFWIDIFFESPSMNQVRIHDIVLSRHPRAEL